jgi:hypothetical protein
VPQWRRRKRRVPPLSTTFSPGSKAWRRKASTLAALQAAALRFYRASADRASKLAASIDVSWMETAQARARAKQMAHQAAAATAAPEKTGGPERPARTAEQDRMEDPIEWPRRNFAGAPFGWRRACAAQSSSYAQQGGAEDASVSPSVEADSNAKASAQDAGATPIEAAPGPNPVHALRRLLGELPWGWWRLEALKARKRRKAAAAEAAPSPQPKAAGAPKSEDEAIARELGPRTDLALAELRRIRREFAKKNHPDRIEPALRVNAARRMTIANMLIDAQMRLKSPPK